MNTFILIFVVLGVCGVELVFFARREAVKHDTRTWEEFVGICSSVLELRAQKQSRKVRILNLLKNRFY